MTGRRSRLSPASSALLAVVLGAGCGTEDPPESLEADDYFPVTVGTRWETVVVEGEVTERHFKGITDCAPALEVQSDCDASQSRTVDAVVQQSTGDSDPLESGFTYLTTDSDGFYRVLQERKDADEAEPEVVRSYWPGFLRFPRGPLESGRTWSSSHESCELDTTGPDPAVPTSESDSYEWTIESMGPLEVEGLSDPFEETVALRRVNVGSGNVKVFWFAHGVGKVLEREMDGDRIASEERIVSWEIGAEDCVF